MKDIDWEEFAGVIDSVIVDAQQGLGHIEAMKNIPLERQLFERLIMLCERAGLVKLPKKDKDGVIRGQHMWHLLEHGWSNPHEHWIRVEGESRQTLYHAYQILTGAITHKPEWKTDGRILKGRTLTMGTFEGKLRKVDTLMRGIGIETMAHYSSEIDRPIKDTDWDDMRHFVTEKGVLSLGDHIPTASQVLASLEV
jgi:hypothetical protein